MARLNQDQFTVGISHAIEQAAVSDYIPWLSAYWLDVAARLLVKQYIAARREREARKVQQCYHFALNHHGS